MSRGNYTWPFDPLLAKQLGFDYFAVGGSRSYNAEDHLRLARIDEQRDWDLIGIVKTKNVILSLVLDNAPRLNALLGISKAEKVRWQALSESDNTGWTVLRYSGFGEDTSKRSLKIISYDDLLSILAEPTAVDIVNVLYQPLRYSEDLCILYDMDLVCPSGDHSMAFAGVTIDLFLTSTPVLDVSPEITKRLVNKFLHKWATNTNSPSILPLVPTLHGSQNFDTCFAERLQMRLREASEGLPQHKRALSQLWSTHLVSGRNKRIEFLPLKQDHWVDSFIVSALPQKEPLYVRPVEFVLDPHQQYSPSPFTSNSTGSFGKIRLPHKAEWQSTYMKRSPTAPDEISALVDVQRYFPKDCTQEVLAVDDALGIIYFRVYQGVTLNEHRLTWNTNRGLRSGKVQSHVVDGFLDVELQRAEQVTDVYRKTMTVDVLPSQCDRQRIHRFYYQRLCSDNRFMQFYEKSISSICNNQIATISEFLDMGVHINGVACESLRSIFGRAMEILNPHSATGLSSLPVAFGLGDSHGGNIMINPDNFPKGYIHIDYEVSGFHCPFLDMAKGIYLDGFFNASYADLLTNSIVGQCNESGAIVTWDIRDNILYIDYELEVDEIGEVTGFAKLEYILRPTLEYMMRRSLPSAKLAEDILSSALLCCATLTRDFSKRPDVFFLNLALGVDLANNMMAVFRKTFKWNPPLHWPSLNSEVGKCLVGEGLPSSITSLLGKYRNIA
ncbi:hypothetical protein ZTR_00789 [Talaromyces verruculosus]|nr:hypothetical protein ZTR_00789 [Talaromyces verruculosus]